MYSLAKFVQLFQTFSRKEQLFLLRNFSERAQFVSIRSTHALEWTKDMCAKIESNKEEWLNIF